MTEDTVVAGLLIIVGLVGVVVPVIPGLLLVWVGVGTWALARQDATGWTTLAVATVLLAIGSAVKYLVPGRRLRRSGVPWTTLFAGGVLGVVGFFVIPVVGLFVGFVLGIYLAERARLQTHAAAWPSTVEALKGAGLSVLIELATGLVVAAVWLVVVLVA